MQNVLKNSLKGIAAVALVAGSVGLATPAHADATAISTLLGAGAGGYVGNQFGRGAGNVAATIGGVAVGGLLGNAIGSNIDRNEQRNAIVYNNPPPTQVYVQPRREVYYAPRRVYRTYYEPAPVVYERTYYAQPRGYYYYGRPHHGRHW